MKKKKDTSPRVYQRDKLKGNLELKPLNWTPKQKELLDLALSKESKVIFITGPAGTSKTILAAYSALELINQHRLSDILYLRSAVESADSKLGFLPGDIEEKIHYYGVPFFDKLEELLSKTSIDSLIKEKRFEVFPVNYVRGQSWNARAIIVDEAQNLTRKELVTVLTRIGKFSKCFVLADPKQSDINGRSGYTEIRDLFVDEEAARQGIHHFEFTKEDIMRSELCKFLVERFEMLPIKETSSKGH
jgi:phosphate starvation-inducible protein PhoH and related proteins